MSLFKKKNDGYYHISDLENKYPGALYYMVFGEKSNGKTYSILEKIIKNYTQSGEQGAIIRRWDMDFKKQTGKTMFASFVNDPETGENKIEKWTNGRYDDVLFYNGTWTLVKHDYEGEPGHLFKDSQPMAYAFTLNNAEHTSGSSYPGITTILFDEFMSFSGYLPDEFVAFQIIVSNIVRKRHNVKIYMMGNTINKSCPYFREMGLSHLKDMKQGDTALYTYGNSKLKVAVEFCNTAKKNGGKASDDYFAFDNPALDMITEGAWMTKIYPHKPVSFDKHDIKFTYFIQFEEQILQCEIIMRGHYNFTFVHPKTTPLRHENKDLIFSQEANPLFNFSRKINQGMNKQKIVEKILQYYNNEKIFYSDNSTGEIMRNYIMWCKRANILS